MDFVQDFAREHVAQISATIALVTYAVSRNKLTPAGVLSGVVVAIIHMLHPWQAFFWLLMVFFLLGTLVTKVRRHTLFVMSIITLQKICYAYLR